LLIHRSAHTSHDPVCDTTLSVHTRSTVQKKNFIFSFLFPSGGIGGPSLCYDITGSREGNGGPEIGMHDHRPCAVYFYPNPPTFPYPWRHIRNSTPLHPRHPIASHEEKAVRTHTYIIGSSYIHVHTYTNSLYLSFLSVGARVSGEGFSLISWLRAQREAACHCTSVLKSCTK